MNAQSLIDKLMLMREKEIQDTDNGKLTSRSNVKKIYEKWLQGLVDRPRNL